MEKEKPLVDRKYILEKFPGKGGWIYAAIPEISQNKKAPFGWVKVKGRIHGYEIKNYKLMPMGNGQLFLPVKAAIRKKIGKGQGDWIHVTLFADNAPTEIPEELLLCLKDAPTAYQNFLCFTDGQQKEYIDWIYSAKTDDTRINRIVETLNRIERGQKLKG